MASKIFTVFGHQMRFHTMDFDGHKSASFYTPIGKWKGLEIEVSLQLRLALSLSLEYTTKCDHAGLHLAFSLFGLDFGLNLYDGRHWNYKANRWYTPGEEQAEDELDIAEFQLANLPTTKSTN